MHGCSAVLWCGRAGGKSHVLLLSGDSGARILRLLALDQVNDADVAAFSKRVWVASYPPPRQGYLVSLSVVVWEERREEADVLLKVMSSTSSALPRI